ncbi:MAG: class I SAM-dependent methyltransferase [Proteobacteria bacterium]|nr:class I SAM-dependent methyltransferase [Pseudomonadota bacterium]
MNAFVKLVNIYEAYGYSVQTGLSPLHFPGHSWADIPFTYFIADEKRAAKGGGIAIAEIYFLDALFSHYRPKNIFVVGNAFGWSTLALSILNPDARVVAIDACPRPEEEEGIRLTNQIASDFDLNLIAVNARSPEQVAEVARIHLDGAIDFAFIDGGHTNEQQNLDFGAIKPVAAEDCVYLFHDVINFMLLESFTKIIQETPSLEGHVLFRTPSGMAIGFPQSMKPLIGEAIHAFSEPDAQVQSLLETGRNNITAQRNGNGSKS